MAATETEICNLALDILTKSPLTNVNTDDTPESRWCLRNYAQTRDAELRKHAWHFAIRRASLTADDDAPPHGDWRRRYAYPADCMRILPPRLYGQFEAPPIPHEIEADPSGKRWIYANQASPLPIRYIFQVVDVTRFDALFVDAIAASLAMRGAHRFTGKQSMIETAAGLYASAIADAMRANAIEGTPERPYDDDVIEVRYQ